MACDEIRLLIEERCLERISVLAQNLVGGTNGNHTHDTSWSSNNFNRSILLTERRMSGKGGDDFICGHCGHVMLEDFDPSAVSGNPVYRCGVCENNNDLPFAASDGRHWPSR